MTIKLDKKVTFTEPEFEEYQLCPYSHEPNEETKKAIEDAENGIGLTSAASVDELFEKLSK